MSLTTGLPVERFLQTLEIVALKLKRSLIQPVIDAFSTAVGSRDTA